MNDEKIIELFYARDERAIEAVKSEYGSFCRGLAMNILNDAEDSDECVSDVLLALWNNIPPEKPASLKAYAGAVTKKKALAKLRDSRSKKRSNGLFTASIDELSECLPSGESVEDAAGLRSLTRLINDWLRTLGREDRVLFVRRYWYDDPVGALAKKLGQSPQRVSQRLFALRKKLRSYLEKEGINV